MTEPAKVGLLLCPRCQNPLPELTGYSVFQCGGCGSVLRANNKDDEANASTGKLNDERVEKGSHKLEKFDSSDKQAMNLSDGFESDVKSNTSSKNRSDRKEFLRNKWAFDTDLESSKNYDINEMSSFQIPREFDDLRTRNGDPNLNGSQRTVRKFDWRTRERSDIEQFQNTQKIDVENVSMYSEDGPSNYPNRINRVEFLEQDRAELLRKLNELNKQIHQSCDLGDRSKEMNHQERRVVHQDPYGGSMEYSIPNRHQMAMSSSQIQGFGDPFRSQMLNRAPRQPQSNPFGADNYIPNVDPFSPSNSINLHHPSCSCFHCYNEHQRAPKRFSNVAKNPTFSNHENPHPFTTRHYDPRVANPVPLSSRNPHSYTRWPSEVNSEFEPGGFFRHRPRRLPVAASGRWCCPVAGGAPFVTCFNCFELLQLPKKLLPLVNKNQKKMKCGACSTIVFFTITNNKLVVSSKSNVAKKVDSSNRNTKLVSTDFSSEVDYDNSAYDFQSMDMKVASSSTDMRSLHTTSSCVSEDEDGSSHLITRKNRSGSSEPPMTKNPSPPPNGSALQDHLDYSTKYNALNRLTIGSQSGRFEQGKINQENTESDQNFVKDNLGTNATEIDISSNEFSHTVTSQDSGEGSRGEDQMRIHKGAESFFGGIIKKGFKDNLRSKTITEEERMSSVTVNGHLILDRLVKKAEKLAGPIQPGEYWYDFRAGFWGVMGGPCLGIIPPFIEEFNYPMREDCAGGNTGILVNGREITEKDLNLLGSRGLPTEEHRSYVLEISGRILDVDSGEELVSLGKLAPTIEKMKHGFGMKVPRAARNA